MKTVVLFALALISTKVSAQKVIDCSGSQASAGCKVRYVQGQKYTMATDGAVAVIAAPQTQLTNAVVSQTVGIVNLSGSDIDVDPALFTGKMQSVTVPVADAQAVLTKYARDQRKSLAWRGALASALMGAAGNDSALATDSNGGHSITYATSRTTVNGASSNIDAGFANASKSAIRRNTLSPKQYIEGAIYFSAATPVKKRELVTLGSFTVSIGDTRFVF